MIKPIDMPTMTQRSMDLVQSAQEQQMRAELANEHANRMNRQSVEQMANTVTQTEKSEFSRISEKRESNSGGGQGGKKPRDEEKQQAEKDARLPSVGYEKEKRLDIQI